MANDLQTAPEPTMTHLVSGIIHDTQDLLKQQLALFRHEIASDFTKTKEAALSLALGVGVGLIGGWLLVLMLVHLLNWATELPLWGCYGIVGGALTLLGAAFYFAGKKKFESFNPLPNETAEALKENIQCLMNPK